MSSHIVTEVKKANKMMGLIRRSHTHLDITYFRGLFNSLVRPHLEYCVSICYPLLKKKCRTYRKCFASSNKIDSRTLWQTYKERLAAIKVPSMRYHRMRGDMILVYKILRGDNQSVRDLFMINESRTRCRNFKLYEPLTRTTIRKHFF